MRTTKQQQQQQQRRNKRRPRWSSKSNNSSCTSIMAPPPSSFTCPLTLTLMDDPVQDQCGHNFERAAILAWLQQQPCCPISRKPIRNARRDLQTNHVLAEQIEQWKWHRDVGDALQAELMLEQQQEQQQTNEEARQREEARNRTKSDRDADADVDVDSSIEFEKSTLQDDDDEYEDVELGSVHVTERERHYSFPTTIRKHRPHLCCEKVSAYCSYSRAITSTADHPAAVLDATASNTMMLLPQERQLLQWVQAREEAERQAKQRRQTCFWITMLLVFLAGLTVGAARTLQLK